MGLRGEDRFMTNLRTLVDDAAEVLVDPSFARMGFRLRRRLFDWEDAESFPMAGRTVVLTGPTSGLGRAAAGSFARMGARLVLVGRDAGRLERTRAELVADVPGCAGHRPSSPTWPSLASVRAAARADPRERAAARRHRRQRGRDVPRAREVTSEGIERTFATMVVGPFVLVSPAAAAAHRRAPTPGSSPSPRAACTRRPSRSTTSASSGERTRAPRAYARAKRAQVALVREWARRLRRGLTRSTRCTRAGPTRRASRRRCPGSTELIGGQLRSADEGVDTILWLAAAPGGRGSTSGRLFLDRRSRPFDRHPVHPPVRGRAGRLWDRVVALTGEAEAG